MRTAANIPVGCSPKSLRLHQQFLTGPSCEVCAFLERSPSTPSADTIRFVARVWACPPRLVLFERYLQKMLSRVITPLDTFTKAPEAFSCSWARQLVSRQTDARRQLEKAMPMSSRPLKSTALCAAPPLTDAFVLRPPESGEPR